MAKQIDFKSVAKQLRYDILGGFQMLVPSDFEKLSETQKLDYYDRIFTLHHDCCNFLTSYLDIDDLNQDYNIND